MAEGFKSVQGIPLGISQAGAPTVAGFFSLLWFWAGGAGSSTPDDGGDVAAPVGHPVQAYWVKGRRKKLRKLETEQEQLRRIIASIGAVEPMAAPLLAAPRPVETVASSPKVVAAATRLKVVQAKIASIKEELILYDDEEALFMLGAF